MRANRRLGAFPQVSAPIFWNRGGGPFPPPRSAALRALVLGVSIAGAGLGAIGCDGSGADTGVGSGGQPGSGGAIDPTTGSGGTGSGAGGMTGVPDGGASDVAGTGGGSDAGVIRGTGGSAGSGAGGRTGTGGAAGSGAGGMTTTGAGGAPAVGPNPSVATRMICTGTDPIECHFGGAPGNYDVTVVLGGAAAGNTIVQAERFRTMLGAVATAAGETRRYTFTVNVRQPEGEPIQAVPTGTPGLDVYFLGNAGQPPQLQSIGYALAPAPFMVYVGGDSTVCDQPTLDYGGWAQQVPQYFNYPLSIANYADSGESSGSFLGSGALFGAIESRLHANDWVLLQFGHNDKTNTAANFHDNLTAMVTRVKAKGAFPVLVTPVARAQFVGSVVGPQHINDTGANLPVIVKQVATEQNVPVLDMTARTVQWLTQLGPNGWQQYHALGTDVTHTNPAGAAVEAGFVRDLIVQANLTALVSRLR
jgi:lysophospholipase L1-like esterase